jgi:pSer/pThr/pTyr-binding forkhead associated (FHA) protein
MKVVFVFENGPLIGTRFEVTEPGTYILGRSSGAHLRTDGRDFAISREHLEIHLKPPRVIIQHISKSNPTHVNDQHISEAEITDQDLIRIGHSTFRVYITDDIVPNEEEGDETSEIESAPLIPDSYICYKCGADLSEKADSDGQAKRLLNKVTYCCKTCVPQGQYLPGDKFADYQLVLFIDTGGMGSVYLVYHTETARLLVVKKMLKNFNFESQKKHFKREIGIHQNLDNPFIIHCITAGIQGETPYLILEYADSGNLHDYYFSREFNVSLPESITFFQSILNGCSYLHSFEPPIIHRDLKPWNFLLKKHDDKLTVKISDFGLSKIYDKSGISSLTKIGDVKGSIAFMSPKQLNNAVDAGCQDDIFSIGVTFYYLLSGKLPYQYPSPFEINKISDMYKRMKSKKKAKLTELGYENDLFYLVLSGATIPLEVKAPHLPEQLTEIIDKAIAPPLLRYRDVNEFRKDLRNFSKTLK